MTSGLERFLRRLAHWWRFRAGEADLEAELSFHREAARAVWLWPWLEGLWQDAKGTVRGLRRSPACTAGVMLTFALGVGVNAASTWRRAAGTPAMPTWCGGRRPSPTSRHSRASTWPSAWDRRRGNAASESSAPASSASSTRRPPRGGTSRGRRFIAGRRARVRGVVAAPASRRVCARRHRGCCQRRSETTS